jgi:hypothetical protein
MRGLIAVVLGVALGIGSVACAVEPTVTPPASTIDVATPVLGAAVRMEDVEGDVVDLDGRPGATPAYIDVRELVAASDGTTLQLTLTVAEALPRPAPRELERLGFNFEVFTGDPVSPENAQDVNRVRYTITAVSGPIGEGLPATYHPGIYDFTRGPDPVFHFGPQFPGTLDVTGDTIVLTVALSALGDPDELWIAIRTVSTFSTSEGEAVSSTGDTAPDAERTWMTLRP